MRFKESIIDYLFIIIVAVIAYWPVSFMLFSLKNDAINYFLAMRYNTSEALQNGIFPAWSPYINLGYPLHGDVQSGVWNPVVIIMSLIRKYDIYWLHIETVITIIISGAGMYNLLKYFKLSRNVILTITAAYMMNGYITDSGQFLNWLYAAAYLPFVFLATIRCFTTFKTKDAFFLGLAYSLMLLSAYPSDFIQLSYILIAFTIAVFFRKSKEQGIKHSLFVTGKQLFVAAVSFIIICLPAILSYVPFMQSVNRGAGINLETALMNSLSPVNLISFIVPWPTLNLNWNQYTDPLIRNCYSGVIPFLFFLFSLVSKRKKLFIEWFLIGVFLFFILFSLGEIGGLRVFSFNYLPLMNTFRHPANAKLFFIFAVQVLSAIAINKYLLSSSFNTRAIKRLVVGIACVILIIITYSVFRSNLYEFVPSVFTSEIGRNQLKIIKDNLSFYDFLLLNSLLVFVVLLVTYWLIHINKLRKYLPLIVITEMFIVAQGMLPLTFVRTSPPSEVQQIINIQPKGYPVPDANISVAEYSAEGKKHFELLGCLNPYNKKPGRIDYIITPANLSTQEAFWDDVPLRNKIIQYPILYFADTAYSTKDTAAFISSAAASKAVIVDRPIYQSVNHSGVEQIEIRSFRPGYVSIETNSNRQALLIFQQNFYTPWTAYVNNKKAEIIRANITFMAVPVPAGNNTVEFSYKLEYLNLSTTLSVTFLFMAIVYFYLYSRKKH